MTDYIEINKAQIPYSFQISLGDTLFTLTFRYNRTGDFFTVDLEKDGELICAGEKLVYGQPLWRNTYRPGKYPAVTIVPQSKNRDDVSAVTYDNFNELVYLYIDNGED